jgi:hypothetical protein
MRLLHTSDLILKDFLGADIPPYAILSHTWGEEEVLFADMNNGNASVKKGFAKVKGCCAKAAQDGFEWVWIDTLCIDKTSSAELSEAINSMYRWYAMSAVCYAFLEDVSSEGMLPLPDFRAARWFSRGWTLQELIAPKRLEFYSQKWEALGSKWALKSLLSFITGIPRDVLVTGDLKKCNAAQIMSWASKRSTTREEDEAYCLLGLFDINLPLLYGEGRKAFMRLQEQILRGNEDYSLMMWSSTKYFQMPALMDSPAYFAAPPVLSHVQCEFKSIGVAKCLDKGMLSQRNLSFESMVKTPMPLDHPTSLVDRSSQSYSSPEMTGRILRIMLLALFLTDDRNGYYAYLGYTTDNYLICLPLIPSMHSSSVHARDGSVGLILISHNAGFAFQQLHLDISLPVDYSLLLSHQLYDAGQGIIKIKNGSVGPTRLLDVFRTSFGDERVINVNGDVEIDMLYSYPGYMVELIAVFGSLNNHPSPDQRHIFAVLIQIGPSIMGTCLLKEILGNDQASAKELFRPDGSLDSFVVRPLCKAAFKDDINNVFGRSQRSQGPWNRMVCADRSVVVTENATVLAAALTLVRDGAAIYELQLSVGTFEEVENWVRMLLYEKEIASESATGKHWSNWGMLTY